MLPINQIHLFPCRNETGPKQLQLQQANGAGFTAYDTMAV